MCVDPPISTPLSKATEVKMGALRDLIKEVIDKPLTNLRPMGVKSHHVGTCTIGQGALILPNAHVA